MIREEITLKHHSHWCPSCKKDHICAFNKCIGQAVLWCSERCGASEKIKQHWREVRRFGHSEINVNPKTKNKKVIPMRKQA